MRVPCKNIPTYNVQKKEWTTTSFKDQKEFGKFLLEYCFKEPGEYNFPDSVNDWNIQARNWEKDRTYTNLIKNSMEYFKHWDDEVLKSRLGVIWIDGEQTFYLTRDYYFLLNYCRIINKEKGQEDGFLSVRDVQYHMMLYIKLAEIFHKYAVILKRRQMAYSVCLVGKTLNYLYFENKKTLKWFASSEAYLDATNGSWKMLEGMKDFLSKETPWKKVFSPSVYPNLQQKIKIKTSSGWVTKGNQSTLVAKSLHKDPKSGVGGATYMAWYEEGGIAPTADETLQYMKPALESGNEKVGIFILGGSVGDLEQCKPLELMMKDPEAYEMFWVDNKWFDKSRVPKKTGLFIPAQYGMPQAVDKNGNSLVDVALSLLDKSEELAKRLSTENYTIAKSQQPRYLVEAFSSRTVSRYPIDKIDRRQLYIESNPPFVRRVNLFLNKETNKVEWENTTREPMIYPVDKKLKDKRGCVLIHELPEPESVRKRMYFAGVDNVEVDMTTTSDSLFSVYIIKSPIKLLETDEEGKQKVSFTGGNIVASWTGRYDSVDETNEVGELLIRMYNAFTLCERNKPNFINHMKKKGLSKLLARESDIPMFKDLLDLDKERNDNYGISIAANGPKKNTAENSLLYWINTELDTVSYTDKNGEDKVVQSIRRVDTIDDKWILEELKYDDTYNTDRKDALRLATLLYSVYETEGLVVTVNKVKTAVKKIINSVKSISFINNINSNSKKKTVSFINNRQH